MLTSSFSAGFELYWRSGECRWRGRDLTRGGYSARIDGMWLGYRIVARWCHQCVVRMRRARGVLDKLKKEGKDLQNVALERDKFRERMEKMRIEMERVKMASKKEEEEYSDRAKREASERDGSDNAAMVDIGEELCRVKEELASARESLEQERQQSNKVREWPFGHGHHRGTWSPLR